MPRWGEPGVGRAGTAEQHLPALLVGAANGLGPQRGLADAGLTLDHEDGGSVGGRSIGGNHGAGIPRVVAPQPGFDPA
jgi:hypothetical protein